MHIRRLYLVAPTLLVALACGSPTEPQPDDEEEPKQPPGEEVAITVTERPLLLV